MNLLFCFSLFRRTQRIMQELTEACQQNSACSSRAIPVAFERLACIRKCVSPNCYAAVYMDQPLEPGEIDVNYSKYKACFHRHWKSRYSKTYDHLNELWNTHRRRETNSSHNFLTKEWKLQKSKNLWYHSRNTRTRFQWMCYRWIHSMGIKYNWFYRLFLIDWLASRTGIDNDPNAR